MLQSQQWKQTLYCIFVIQFFFLSGYPQNLLLQPNKGFRYISSPKFFLTVFDVKKIETFFFFFSLFLICYISSQYLLLRSLNPFFFFFWNLNLLYFRGRKFTLLRYSFWKFWLISLQACDTAKPAKINLAVSHFPSLKISNKSLCVNPRIKLQGNQFVKVFLGFKWKSNSLFLNRFNNCFKTVLISLSPFYRVLWEHRL